MTKNSSLVLLPLDNRPVSYLLPKQIADFSNIDLILPERKYLGDLKRGSDLEYIENWCRGLINQTLTLVIALDNWIYGGLVNSRKHSYDLNNLRYRVEILKEMKSINKYGFSSIMRIPDYNNSSEEEKDYWKNYGENIFRWSELMYKVGRGIKEEGVSNEELIESWYQSSQKIPASILADYKGHRDKNFTINLLWLESLHHHCFEYLIFSCDDSREYGMNVVEAEYLRKEISKHRFENITSVISGTDEIPLVLLTKAIIKCSDKKPSVSLFFDSVKGKNQISRYESDTIYNSVLNQINTLGIEVKDFNESDLVVCIHCADSIQGDHLFGERPDNTIKNAAELVKLIQSNKKSFILIDLAYANGADPELIEILLDSNIDWQRCYGFSAWNTTSNSIGSALSIGINRWISEIKNSFNEDAFKKCLVVRFLDDYAYQAKIRHKKVTRIEINEKIKPYAQTFSKLFDLSDIKVNCCLPWKRSFEVEIEL